MKLQIFKPVTSSQRNLIKIINKNLKRAPYIKNKLKGLKKTGGRNFSGKITSFQRGGGHKQAYRVLDFYRIENLIGIVTSVEYDPNRTSYIASIYDFHKKNYFYIIAPKNLVVGNIIKSGLNAEVKLGHSLPISKIPIGCLIHNLAPKRARKAKISRSAGSFCHVIEKTSKLSEVKLSSGIRKKLSVNCYASIGMVSNELHFLRTLGKAGRSRWLNKRPRVRGVAMNPIDHPNGGGEGKKSGKNVNPWGKSKFRKTKILKINDKI